ncbi:protein NLP7-like [Rhododendron vialii]|uniref:protein NLP7-like n=1 Tax=Rhododendron vialii TaxID=182163 RepID=UPI00265E90EE|nr:protein NLP7-like [Rhododendron vialii]
MGMCREYNNKFYADAESGEDQLGLPGRVFLNQLPEYTPHVGHYTLKEYPQLDLALRCGIYASWALPVFEHFCHTCVGVLEIVCQYSATFYDENFLSRMYDIFQEFGLRCFDGYKHCKMQELKMVYESVCKIHNLPLALTWVYCRSCNDLLQSQFQCTVLEYLDKNDFDLSSWILLSFVRIIKFLHLRKGHITGRILPFPNLLYCSDIKQFSIAESPLVPYARLCKLSGWFTMCLQSGYTGDELYVLEFFLPESDENDENILTKLRLILGTMVEHFKTFKLASGQGLGEALSVEVIDFQNGQKSHSIQMIPATGCIPSLELLQDGGVMLQQDQQEQPSIDVINSAQNYNLPFIDSLQNGKVTKQVDSSDQQSMNPSNKGQNVITAERNILVVSSSKKGKRRLKMRNIKKLELELKFLWRRSLNVRR